MTKWTVDTKKGVPYPFGVTSYAEGLNFAVFAKDLSKLFLSFFDDNNLEKPFQEIELDPKVNKTGHVWHIWIKGLPPVFNYAYHAINQDHSNFLLDPYAKCIASTSQWNEIEHEKKYWPRGTHIQNSTFDWEGDTPLGIPRNQLIIYEMHVRGFTQHPSSQVKNPGKYAGIIEKIPYLKELGVNALELMPINEFDESENIHQNQETKQKLNNYFGYSSINWFCPMNRYAVDSKQGKAIDEFKTLVKTLHKNGIEVILDIVFNHTAEGNEKGPVLSFKGFDAKTYYMLNPEGNYLNFSGCGNTFNCNHPVAIELLLNVLRYWAVEMHVDGFRFDLASIMSRGENGAPLESPPIIEAFSKDPVLGNVKLIAEAWDAGGLYQLGFFAGKSQNWSEWNGKYRDTVRHFIKGSSDYKKIFSGALTGSHDIYGLTGTPSSSINFLTSHDGFTLADLVSYNEKHNENNGEENKDGLNENASWNCGQEGDTEDAAVIKLRKRQMRNLHLALMLSQGIPLVLMGDEYGHTRKGNNNGWSQDNELNWFLWDQLKDSDFLRFYRAVIHFRKKYPLFNQDKFITDQNIAWHGLTPNNPDWDNDNHFVAFSLIEAESKQNFYVAFNAGAEEIKIEIPPPSEGKQWGWCINTNQDPPQDFYEENTFVKVEGTSLTMGPYSAIVLKSN